MALRFIKYPLLNKFLDLTTLWQIGVVWHVDMTWNMNWKGCKFFIFAYYSIVSFCISRFWQFQYFS